MSRDVIVERSLDAWRQCKLGEDATLVSGQHVMARDVNFRGDGVPYLTGPADFPHGVIVQTKYTVRPTKMCRAGDILVTVKGSGAGSLVQADREYCISRQLMAIRPGVWDTFFLYYSLVQNAGRIREASAGLIPGLSRSDILEQSLPIPGTVAEQRRLGLVLQDSDDVIVTLERLIAKKQAIKQGMMQQLLTGRTRLPGFTDSWVKTATGNLLDFKNGLNKGGEYFGSGTPIVNFMDVMNGPIIELGDVRGRVMLARDEIKRFSAQKGDLFFTRTSETVDEVGTAAVLVDDIADACFSGFILRGRPRSADVDSRFLARAFQLNTVRAQVASSATYTTRALTNGRSLGKVMLDLPPVEEQRAIAEVIDDADMEIEALRARCSKARALKSGMMQQLLTGRTRLPVESES